MQDQRMYYRKALEVVGMLGSRRTLYNALNRIAAHAEDMGLVSLVTKVQKDVMASQTNTLSCPLVDMSQSRGSAAETVRYCRNKLAIPVK